MQGTPQDSVDSNHVYDRRGAHARPVFDRGSATTIRVGKYKIRFGKGA
jgi:hypothetical protein